MWIKGVVEVEDPGLDIAETAQRLSGQCWHGYGSLKRTVVDGLPARSITAKPAEFRPRIAQSLWSASSKRPSRVHSATEPPQASGTSPRLTRRPLVSTASA